MHILTLNSGSSSIKFSLISVEQESVYIEGIVENIGSKDTRIRYDGQEIALRKNDYKSGFEAIKEALIGAPEIEAVGHRVVHGGERFTQPAVITDEVLGTISECIPLAPLHNPANILGIETAKHLFPDKAQIAVFDTAFHQTMPKHAYLYALPYELYTRFGIRRYGFHGISHKYVTEKASKDLGKSRFISCHLGNGCSACAVKDGKSLDTTMGMTPLEGLVMGSRSGDIDPGIFGFLCEKMKPSEVMDMLNKESGLLGISGESMDMRTLEASENEQSILAIDLFCYRLAKAIMALSIPLGAVDAVIFTGGIGENSKRVKNKVAALLPKGMEIVVIPTNEEVMIARETARLI